MQTVNSEVLRQLAAKIYRLMLRVRTDAAREQLKGLAEELDENAQRLEDEEHRETSSRR